MIGGLLKTMRPHQWVKNLFVLAPLVFAQELFDAPVVLRALAAFACFSLASSAVYILNDLVDVEADRAHPVKRLRAIASGRVTMRAALTTALLLTAVSLGAAWLVSPLLLASLVGYLLLNRAYSLRLKHIAYVDVLCIALGFELRVLAGSFAIAAPPSAYLLVVTFLLASFLGFGKRMHELKQGNGAARQRSVLTSYREGTLGGLLAGTALATLATYVVYTLDPGTRRAFGTDYLVVTSVFTVAGVLRFLHLMRGSPHAESPTEEMLRDPPFLLNLVLWTAAVVIVIYYS